MRKHQTETSNFTQGIRQFKNRIVLLDLSPHEVHAWVVLEFMQVLESPVDKPVSTVQIDWMLGIGSDFAKTFDTTGESH